MENKNKEGDVQILAQSANTYMVKQQSSGIDMVQVWFGT
jgi:hypothetical protein